PGARFTNGPVQILGTATDDVAVARVVYSVDSGPFLGASGSNNWTASFTPHSGFNSVAVQSIDWDGHWSSNAPVVSFFYVSELPLDLRISGRGTVSGAT